MAVFMRDLTRRSESGRTNGCSRFGRAGYRLQAAGDNVDGYARGGRIKGVYAECHVTISA